jgi:hypothetical protein
MTIVTDTLPASDVVGAIETAGARLTLTKPSGSTRTGTAGASAPARKPIAPRRKRS